MAYSSIDDFLKLLLGLYLFEHDSKCHIFEVNNCGVLLVILDLLGYDLDNKLRIILFFVGCVKIYNRLGGLRYLIQ